MLCACPYINRDHNKGADVNWTISPNRNSDSIVDIEKTHRTHRSMVTRLRQADQIRNTDMVPKLSPTDSSHSEMGVSVVMGDGVAAGGSNGDDPGDENGVRGPFVYGVPERPSTAAVP